MQGVDDEVPIAPAARALLAGGGRFARLDRGWRLEPLDGGRARLTVERAAVLDAFPEEKKHRQVLVRVQARRPLPSRLASRPFDVPPRATIELAYGTLGAPPGEVPPPVELRATLDCGGRTTPLLATTVAPGATEARWRTHRAELPRSDVPCSLELVQADAAGKASPFVVWGAARISVPADDDLQIVLISLDTLRADHVSGYGYPRRTTPEIDRRLIEQGVRFADASHDDRQHRHRAHEPVHRALSRASSGRPDASSPRPDAAAGGAPAGRGLPHGRDHRGRAASPDRSASGSASTRSASTT